MPGTILNADGLQKTASLNDWFDNMEGTITQTTDHLFPGEWVVDVPVPTNFIEC
jgi:hypothetical protein